jgi:hypothetical protein
MKRITVTFTLALMSLLQAFSSVSNVNNLLITTQGQIDSFNINYGCDTIYGNIIFNGTFDNLNGIQNIKYISGNITASFLNNNLIFKIQELQKCNGIYLNYIEAGIEMPALKEIGEFVTYNNSLNTISFDVLEKANNRNQLHEFNHIERVS